MNIGDKKLSKFVLWTCACLVSLSPMILPLENVFGAESENILGKPPDWNPSEIRSDMTPAEGKSTQAPVVDKQPVPIQTLLLQISTSAPSIPPIIIPAG